jgi:hypothetical protein
VLLIGLAIASSVLVAASLGSPRLVTTLLAAYLALVTNLAFVVLVLSPMREVTRAGLAVAELVLFGLSLLAGGGCSAGRRRSSPRPRAPSARSCAIR